MKNTFRVSGVTLLILSIFLIHSCKKEKNPTLTTSAITNITGTTATSGGTITDEGSGTIIARGVCWSTGITPTIADSKTTDGAGAGSFTSNISGLNGATPYYVRAYATNSAGTGYGMAMSFTTFGQSPTPTVGTATNINTTSAAMNGSVNANYFSTVVTFEYGTTASYGSTVTATQSPVLGNSNTTVNADITGLTIGTIYHYRIKAVNSLGTTNSNDITFTTLGQVPTVATQAATNITTVTATLNGFVNANYLSTVVTFEYGTTTSYGSTVTATQSPVTGNTNITVSINITGLTAGNTYHFRVKAVNSLGTTDGSDLTFTYTITDVEGNIYNTINIGTQIWMKENLKTTKYNDGTTIPLVSDSTTWINLSTPAYCWYKNDATTYKAAYGALYNWYAVNTGKLCPTGWHVSTDTEWTTLTNYLGGESIAGGKLKETGTTHWNNPNTGATNETGFTALPGGYRYDNGAFYYVGFKGFWWSSTEYDIYNAWSRFIHNGDGNVYRDFYSLYYGLSVRCVRDY